MTSMRVLSRTVLPLVPNDDQPYEYQITYVLAPEAAGPIAGTCATVAAGMQTDDSGAFKSESPPGTNFFAPISWTPDNPDQYPSVVIGFMAFANQAGAYGTPPTTVSGFTMMDSSRDGPCNYPFGFSTHAQSAYKVVTSGSPGAMTSDWDATAGVRGYRGLAIYLPTSATSPVQTATQCGSGNTATFADPPTAGNILVLCHFDETGGMAPPSPPTGWTRVAGEVGFSGLGNGFGDSMFMSICVRCVQEGDSATYGTGDNSFSHWAFLSEWEIS